MSTSDDEWTTAHDLALIYSGLACVDRELTDEEVAAIEDPLTDWVPLSAGTTTGEVVQEAATALKQSQKSLRNAVRRVGRTLEADERRETLEDLLRIAQADGVLLDAERELIHQLATVWDLKRLSEDWNGATSAVVERRDEDWTRLHELAFLFVQVGHGTEAGLTADALEVMAERLREWKEGDSGEDIRTVLRQALEVFSDRDEDPLIQDTVEGLGAGLSPVQHLLVLDDLHTVAHVGGPPGDAQQRLFDLAEAWDLSVRVEGD